GVHDQQVHVEYHVGTDHSAAVRTAPRDVAAGAKVDLSFPLTALASNTTFSYRFVSTSTIGPVVSGWATFTTPMRAAKLGVATSTPFVRHGMRAALAIDGLEPGEQVTVRLRDTKFVTRTANVDGTARFSVKIPNDAATGRATLHVEGGQGDRIGRVKVTITSAKRITVTPIRSFAMAGSTIRVTTSGLLAGEPVTLRYRGKIVGRGTASSAGRFTTYVAVLDRPGRFMVIATGSHSTRRGTTTLRIASARMIARR
ncbi:MAG: hypothetical protein ABI200_03540, partial [Gaiellales bacterium]